MGGTASTNAAAVDLGNFGAGTVFTRGNNLKIQDVDTLYAQSDFSTKFKALGVRHEVLSGVDFAQEKKLVYLARSAAQGGIDLTKPTTTAGRPDDGASINEDLRVLRDGNEFTAKTFGVYGQDLVQIAPLWKLLAGLRYDNMDARYADYAIPAAAPGPITTTNYAQKISATSKRLGLLFQPNPLHSTTCLTAPRSTPRATRIRTTRKAPTRRPERSENIELGAKLDNADKTFTTRLALFRSTKFNERNTDPDTAATRLLLSGKRHSAGLEMNVTGRITRQWEVLAPTCGCLWPGSTRPRPPPPPRATAWATGRA